MICSGRAAAKAAELLRPTTAAANKLKPNFMTLSIFMLLAFLVFTRGRGADSLFFLEINGQRFPECLAVRHPQSSMGSVRCHLFRRQRFVPYSRGLGRENFRQVKQPHRLARPCQWR